MPKLTYVELGRKLFKKSKPQFVELGRKLFFPYIFYLRKISKNIFFHHIFVDLKKFTHRSITWRVLPYCVGVFPHTYSYSGTLIQFVRKQRVCAI
jgi:hypothetical protein